MLRYLVWRLILLSDTLHSADPRRTRLVPVTNRTHWSAMTQNAWRLAVVAVGVALLLAGCGPSKPVGAAKANTQVDTSTTTEAVTTTEATTEPAAAPATPADFKLSAKILSQECFGSAGCNLTYRVQVDSGRHDGTYEITYDVIVPGSEDGPHTDTLTVTDGQYQEPTQDFVSTNKRVKSAAKIKVRVTAVEAQ